MEREPRHRGPVPSEPPRLIERTELTEQGLCLRESRGRRWVEPPEPRRVAGAYGGEIQRQGRQICFQDFRDGVWGQPGMLLSRPQAIADTGSEPPCTPPPLLSRSRGHADGRQPCHPSPR